MTPFEKAKTILLTLHWLTNIEQAVGKEKFLDLMPNNFGGRNDLRKLLADDLPPELAYLKDLYTAPEDAPDTPALYKRVELEDGTPVQYVGVYVLHWRADWGQPEVGFVEYEAD